MEMHAALKSKVLISHRLNWSSVSYERPILDDEAKPQKCA